MPEGKYLFLALDGGAWGRAALGIDIARTLCQRGSQVKFVATGMTAPLVKTSGLPMEELPDNLGVLTQLYIKTCLEVEAPKAIVLCDFYSCATYLGRRGIDPMFLLRCNVPTIALDAWDASEKRDQIDSFGKSRAAGLDSIREVTGRLVPVPIGRPTTRGGYCSLPSPLKITNEARRGIRTRNLGIKEGERAVLFCTAGWQHDVKDPNGSRLAEALPRLLEIYLAQLGPSVRLIHVGPASLAMNPTNGYLWLPAVSAADFDRLLGSVDMFLSANISGTTIGRALAAGVPVVVLTNSRSIATIEELEEQGRWDFSPAVQTWLETTLPLYPFSMWPLGYWHYLKPLLHENPYCSAVKVVDLLDETTFIETCGRLLSGANGRDEAMQRQTSYMELVNKLPSAAQLIDSYLN